MIKEFKKFIARGNVIDLAVGVIIGGAFGKIVSSLVDNILMPLIGLIIGGINFSNLAIKIKDTTISYGLFIQNVVDFLIVAFCIFLIVKLYFELVGIFNSINSILLICFINSWEMLFKLIHSAFAQRRKKMINSLESTRFMEMDKNALEKLFQANEINSNARAEELGLDEYIKIVDSL